MLLDLRVLGTRDAAELMDRLVSQTLRRESTVCSLLLATEAEQPIVQRHLSERIALQWSGSPTPRQLRFFDPGTFVQLPRVLGERGMAWLLGPVRSVLAPWAGQWSEYRHAPNGRVSFRVDDSHRQALVALGAVNRVAMARERAADVDDWLARCEQIERHVLRAHRRHGLVQQADLVAFAGHAVDCHPDFDTHPVLVQLFAQLHEARPEDEIDYRELTSSLRPEDWAQVRRDLGEPKNERQLR